MWLSCIFSVLLSTHLKIVSANATYQFLYSDETQGTNGFCWRLSNYSTNWTTAINTCSNLGGFVAPVYNDVDFNAFSNLSGINQVWTNLMAQQNNQSISDYKMWKSNNVTWKVTSIYVPNNDSTCCNEPPDTQTCIRFVPSANTSMDARYMDMQCSNSFRFICSMFPSCPQIANATIKKFYCNGTVSLKCEENFLLSGPSTIFCNVSSEWSVTPTCIPQCSLLNFTGFNVSYSNINRTINTTADITCVAPAISSGPSSVTCLNDQSWSPSIPTCSNDSLSTSTLTSISTILLNATCTSTSTSTLATTLASIAASTSTSASTTILTLTSAIDSISSQSAKPTSLSTLTTPSTSSSKSNSTSTPTPPPTLSPKCSACNVTNYCIMNGSMSLVQEQTDHTLQKLLSSTDAAQMQQLAQTLGYLTSNDLTNPCAPNGFCVNLNTTSSVECICYPTFYGKYCETRNCSIFAWSKWSECDEDCIVNNTSTRKRIGAPDCSESESKACSCAVKDPLTSLERTVVKVINPIGCILLVSFVSASFIIFLIFRIFSVERVLQMGQEISLVVSHLLILAQMIHGDDTGRIRNKTSCAVISIALQYFTITNFTFMALEALQYFSILRNVISTGGYFSRKINMLIGIGVPALIVLATAPFFHKNYITKFSCWLNFDSDLVLACTLLPIAAATILFAILTEAAAMHDIKRFPLTPEHSYIAALIRQKGTIGVVVFNWASLITGSLAVHKQNLAAYVIVFALNGVLGVYIFILHTFNNDEVHLWLHQKFCRKQKVRSSKK